MNSATVGSDRQLRQRLHKLAVEQLGVDADPAAITRLADRWYNGPTHAAAGRETLVERWMREAAQKETRRNLRRLGTECW